jgi:hypothetical protein
VGVLQKVELLELEHARRIHMRELVGAELGVAGDLAAKLADLEGESGSRELGSPGVGRELVRKAARSSGA